jgi:hypothetical protein
VSEREGERERGRESSLRACVCVCARAPRACVCVRVCVRACVRACPCESGRPWRSRPCLCSLRTVLTIYKYIYIYIYIQTLEIPALLVLTKDDRIYDNRARVNYPLT